MKIKEPTRRHKIPRSHKTPSSGKSWMKRQMRKPYRVMFWILVVCWGFALVGGLMMYLDSKNEVANNNINRHKTTVVSEERRVRKPQTKGPAKKRKISYWEERREREKQRQEAERREQEKPDRPKVRQKPIYAPPIISDITPEEIERLFGLWSKLTILQKDELFKNNYKGKWVEWTGKVWSVWGYSVCFEYELDSLQIRTLSVCVPFGPSAKETLLQLRKGQWLTYQGKIYTCEYDLKYRKLDIWLTDGRIIRMSK